MRDLRGRRVLVTGAAGFIGANLTRKLADRGAATHAVVRPGGEPWRIADIGGPLALHRLDLADRAELRRTVREVAPEFVFHLAARGVLPGRDNGGEILAANVLGTANLLEACAPLPYRRFVHVGGSSEYGPKNAPMSEEDLLEPVTPYGAAKAAATIVCRQVAVASRKPIVILRPFSVYGCWEAPTRLVPTAVRAVLCGHEIDLTPPGCRRDLVFADDVVEACLLALEADTSCGEIVNIGSGRQWANEAVVALISEIAGCAVRTRIGAYPPRPSDTAHWVADIRKAGRLLGWRPRHTLRSGLEKTISWIRRHPVEYGLEGQS